MAEAEFKLPWPLSNRSGIVMASGIPIISGEKENILIFSSIPDKPTWLGHEIKRDPNTVYVDIHKAALYVKQIDAETIMIQTITNMDPKLNYIPTSLINYGLKHVCGMFLSLAKKKCLQLEPEYEELQNGEKAEMYDDIRKKIFREEKTDPEPKL